MRGASDTMPLTRRRMVSAGGAALALPFLGRGAQARGSGRVVVVGGGFGGATAARFLAAFGHQVTLVERQPTYWTCPFSNTVLAGLNRMEAIAFGYGGVRAAGVTVLQDDAQGIDPERREVRRAGGPAIPYDRLLLSPGIELRYDALPGYDQAAAEVMPHAWIAGAQTRLLRRQLEAMEDGGTVAIAVPDNPFRCPPGPYERASLIAHYLKAEKPSSKILILDAKDAFSKRPLFEEAWAALYPDMIEWVPVSSGGKVVEVDPATMTLRTDFAEHRVAVANVIPPQRAGAIAETAGVADATGWCPVDPETFESALVPGIHVIGDACLAGAMPKSAFAANAQAKVVAGTIDALLRGEAPGPAKLINTCYSLAAPDHAFNVAGVYEAVDGALAQIEGAGGTSPVGAPADIRAREAEYARAWYATITGEVFG
ncbi:NAD(P)/FAD-dependent oxidoreductase [uncultured Paracoccus sp.]|uniref:NAD(P)/FAD-dependent oxidoreductase n=1 Tax=uncultured Paracoccus sp. TaxID=189685 RepID=UPI00261E4F3C|nr:NAD(P)/FAD-dependent oxidoreductase [uncultured Paracoccus sp.]